MSASSIKRPREKPEPGRKLLIIPFLYYMEVIAIGDAVENWNSEIDLPELIYQN